MGGAGPVAGGGGGAFRDGDGKGSAGVDRNGSRIPAGASSRLLNTHGRPRFKAPSIKGIPAFRGLHLSFCSGLRTATQTWPIELSRVGQSSGLPTSRFSLHPSHGHVCSATLRPSLLLPPVHGLQQPASMPGLPAPTPRPSMAGQRSGSPVTLRLILRLRRVVGGAAVLAPGRAGPHAPGSMSRPTPRVPCRNVPRPPTGSAATAERGLQRTRIVAAPRTGIQNRSVW